MIVEYDNKGYIYHVVSDPVPEGYFELLLEVGRQPLLVSRKEFDPEQMHKYYVDPLQGLQLRSEFSLPAEIVLTQEETFAVPVPCEVLIDGCDATIKVLDGEITLTPAMSDDYEIRFTAWPYIPHTMKVKVHADTTHS